MWWRRWPASEALRLPLAWSERSPELVERDKQQRAKGEVRRWIRCWRCDRLITLTFAVGVYDYDEVVAEIDRFRQRWIRRLGARGAPLLVPEPHPNGHGWHVHGATYRWIDVKILRELWPRGFVHIRRQAHNKRELGPRRLAAYLAKYMTKTYTADELAGCSPRPAGARRYFVPRGTHPTPTELTFPTLAEAEQWIRKNYGEPDYVARFTAFEDGPIEGYWLTFPDSCLDLPPKPVKAFSPAEPGEP